MSLRPRVNALLAAADRQTMRPSRFCMSVATRDALKLEIAATTIVLPHATTTDEVESYQGVPIVTMDGDETGVYLLMEGG